MGPYVPFPWPLGLKETSRPTVRYANFYRKGGVADLADTRLARAGAEVCSASSAPWDFTKNSLYDAGADAELLADLVDAETFGPELHDISFN